MRYQNSILFLPFFLFLLSFTLILSDVFVSVTHFSDKLIRIQTFSYIFRNIFVCLKFQRDIFLVRQIFLDIQANLQTHTYPIINLIWTAVIFHRQSRNMSLENIKALLESKLDTLSAEIKSIKDEFREEVKSQIQDLRNSLEYQINDRIDKVTKDFETKLSDAINSVQLHRDDIPPPPSLRTLKSLEESVNNYNTGFFIADIGRQFPSFDSDRYPRVFTNSISESSNYALAELALDFLSQSISDKIDNSTSFTELIKDRLHMSFCTVAGKSGEKRNLLLKFNTLSGAKIFRSALIEANKRASNSKRPTLKFAPMRSGDERADSSITIANHALYHAKRASIVQAYSVGLYPNYEHCLVALMTKVRFTGHVEWTQLHWSTQSATQAIADLISCIPNPDEAKIAKFKRDIAESSKRRKRS